MIKKFFIPAILAAVALGCASLPAGKSAFNTVFYPPLPQQPRLQFLCTINGEQDIGKSQSAFQEFLLGKPQYKNLGRPYDVGSAKGKIYVLDRMYRKIVILDIVNKTMFFLNDHGVGSLGDPSGIWVSKDDIKYVADMQRKQVVAYDQKNEFLKAYGGKDLFAKPVDVAVFEKRVYVIDMDKHELFILDRNTGRLVKTVGGKGKENGEFFKPTHVTVDPSGNVYVNDAFNFRLQKFTPDGRFIQTIGFHGDRLGGFARPKGLAADGNGNLYAVDAAFENVQIFDPQGRLLLFFGGAGTGPGKLYLPAGIAVDYQNVGYFSKFADPNFKLNYLVYVTSSYGNSKLNVYGFGDWVGEDLPVE